MEELNQFLNSVESSARRILKQQNKKHQELIAKDRAALVRAGKHNANSATSSASGSSSTPSKSAISRDELKASYSPGGALIVQAPPTPTSPLKSPTRRSEHDGDDTYLPRIPQQSLQASTDVTNKGAVSVPPYLPVIDGKRQQQPRDPIVDAARKAQRDKRTADKILSSPLYKSLAKSKSDSIPQGFGGSASSPSTSSSQSAMQSVHAIKKAIHEVDNVNLLLKKLGLRENASPSKRPDHAVEKRMCNACWASPTKATGCEHHNRVMPSNNNNAVSGLTDEAQMLRQMELQGPTSWLSGDLYVKFRSEKDRETLWRAFCRLKDAEAERERNMGGGGGDLSPFVAVIPIVARHPICDKYYKQIELENLKTQAATRRRNQTKAFVFDVNHIWLTNLDHFNGRLVSAQRRRQRKIAKQRARNPEQSDSGGGGGGGDGLLELEPTDPDEDDNDVDQSDGGDAAEENALRDRRDEAAIRDGYCQIQSISTSRALQNAVFPDLDPSMSSFATLQRQSSTRTATTPTTPATPTSRRRRRARELPFKVAPLTLVVSGQWDPKDPIESSSLARVPGVAVVGKQRVLWWRYPYDDPEIEFSRVVAVFGRSKTLSSTNAILVSLLLALDAPLLSPLWFAWHVGSKTPPPQLYEPPIPVLLPPQDVSPCLTSLLSMKLQTRIDSLLPVTIVVLNSSPHDDDFVLALDEPYGHRRFWTQFHKRDDFRQWWRCAPDTSGHGDSLAPNHDLESQPCAVQIAQPNATSVGGRFTWHSVDLMRHDINRPRRERDLVYIIENHTTCGSNGALWFIVAMTHEVMRDVSAAKLSGYLAMLEERRRQKEYEDKLMEIEQKIELGRLQLEAKRQEQKRIEQELSAKAARASDRFNTDKISQVALEEWDERLQQSVATDEQAGWQRREITADQSHVVFYYAMNEALPASHRFSWEKPIVWPAEESEGSRSDDGELTSRSDVSSASLSSTQTDENDDDENDEDEHDRLSEEQKKTRETITQMANALLADEQFLRILKAKLGLESDADGEKSMLKKQRRRSMDEYGDDDHDDDLSADQLDLRDHMIMLTEEQDKSKASLMASKMAKLQLPTRAVKTTPTKPGEGWKRLKVSKLPPSFARSVYATHTEGPRSTFINKPNHATPVGMIDPREASPYEAPEFIPELRALLIPKANADLQEKKLQWAEYLATHPSESELTTATTSGSPGKSTGTKDALFERDPAENDMTMEQLVARAILCARNNNLQGLEDALDSGCEINARDNHGNSLFILVCQQGNKKIAKFLMRRHADLNLQNLNGNTALHYLIEYKHTELADYVKAKGAIDTIQNAAGLTCYEGLSVDQVEKL